MKKKKTIINIVFISLFLIGVLVLIYPKISDMYYTFEATKQISSFNEEKNLLDEQELNRRKDLAQAFNDSLNNVVTDDPYNEERIQKGVHEYARMLEVKEKIGHVQIPAINVDLPIYAGTSDSILEKGAGHLEGTSLPIGGNSSHSVITAHSGLPQAKLFSDLEKMKVGDKFYVHNIFETLAYQVDEITVIEPHEFDKLLIVPGHDYVTLLTCTPISINTHRLLVRGHRVEYVEAIEERIIQENKASFTYKYLFYFACFIILLLMIIIFKLRRRKKYLEKMRTMENKNEEKKTE